MRAFAELYAELDATTSSNAKLAAQVLWSLQRRNKRWYRGQLAKQMISAASTGTRKPIKKNTPAQRITNNKALLIASLLKICGICNFSFCLLGVM